ncbi:MAG: GNAT family N-acetyltransferase [Sphingomonas fennica]
MTTIEQHPADGIHACAAGSEAAIVAIVNAAAAAYRGVIPADRWHDPYMTAGALAADIADGVVVHGCVRAGRLVGVMGIQTRGPVDLIRHAYVLPDRQGEGIGSTLLAHLCGAGGRQTLVGTWQAADWAIAFYRRNGFAPVAVDAIAPLLRRFWRVPERQIAASVVLAAPPLSAAAAHDLVWRGG